MLAGDRRGRVLSVSQQDLEYLQGPTTQFLSDSELSFSPRHSVSWTMLLFTIKVGPNGHSHGPLDIPAMMQPTATSAELPAKPPTALSPAT
jgi:hypothetical protein